MIEQWYLGKNILFLGCCSIIGFILGCFFFFSEASWYTSFQGHSLFYPEYRQPRWWNFYLLTGTIPFFFLVLSFILFRKKLPFLAWCALYSSLTFVSLGFLVWLIVSVPSLDVVIQKVLLTVGLEFFVLVSIPLYLGFCIAVGLVISKFWRIPIFTKTSAG